MSENWITVIPADPFARPDASAIARLKETLAAVAPGAAETRIAGDGEAIRFFDAGANFESVRLPGGALLDMDIWSEAMSADFDGTGFRLDPIAFPGATGPLRLSDLDYAWPQGFARIGVALRDPDIGRLTPEQEATLALAFGAPVQVIYTHI